MIAATKQNLAQLAREGRFHDDLFYRLNVGLHIPPVRERREEIPKLVEHFLDRIAREFHKGRLRLADETMENQQVAKVLGLSRKGLYLKRQRLGIEPVAC